MIGVAWLRALTLASPSADLKDTVQYVLLPADQTKYLTGNTVTLDIIEDLVCRSTRIHHIHLPRV
jgi:hypothetical protein